LATDWASLLVPEVRALEPLDVAATVEEVRALAGHEAAAKLDWNENLFGPLPGVLEEASRSLAAASMYPIAAYDDFCAEVGRHAGVDPGMVAPGHGLQALVGTVASVLLRHGDSVVIPEVSFYLYALASSARGAIVRRSPMRGYAIDLEALAAKARKTGARIAWVCDPNNPTATTLSASEWQSFLDALPDGCVAVVDEAYGDFLPPDSRLPRERDVRKGRPVILVRSFSKLYGLAGLRLGYAIADPAVVRCLAVVDEPFNVNCAALAAGSASLRAIEAAAERRREVAEARAYLADGLREAGAEPLPSEIGFVLVRVDGDDVALTRALAGRGVLVRAGSHVGLPGHLRVAVGPLPLMERAVAAFAEARSSLLG
jgi:histidinol-phosphate aminotransferase